MPFTLSHPAMAIPLRRCGLSLSALVVGSMTPDLGFYVSFSPLGDRSHHELADLLTFCLPAGLIVLWVFHRILKRPLLALLPAAFQHRLEPHAQPFAFGPWRRLLLVVASLLVGTVSHLAWDFLCHTHGWHGRALAFLMTPVVPSWIFGDIRMAEALHGLFSAAGLFILAAMAWRTVMSSPPEGPGPRPPLSPASIGRDLLGVALLLALAVAAFLAAVAGALFLTHTLADEQARRLALYRTVVLTVTFLFVELLLVSVAIHAKRIAERVSDRDKQETP